MKYLLLFIFSSTLLLAQKKKRADTKASLDLLYGQKLLSKSTLNGALNSQTNFQFAKPLNFIGIGTTGNFIVNSNPYQYSGHFSYAQVIPQKIMLNDSTAAMLNGFNITMSAWGLDLIAKKENIDLFFSAGFTTGRLRLSMEGKNKQKNPFLAPIISITPRFIFHKVCVQVRAEYDLDISSKNWRATYFSSTKNAQLERYSNSGFTVSASIGRVID